MIATPARRSSFLYALCLLLACGSAFAAKPPAEPKLKPGDLPPVEVGTTLDGDTVRLDSQPGAVTVVSFWAGWCAPCRKEMSLLDQIQQQVSPEHLRVIAVNIEDRATFRRIQRKLKDSIHFTLSNDPRGVVMRNFGVGPIPHSVYIGRDGRVDGVHLGFSEQQIDKVISELNRLLAAPIPPAVAARSVDPE